jgi:hypothetical protein
MEGRVDEYRQWRRLFGMSLTDFFVGLPVTVEIEKDLSLKQQFLDVLLVRKEPGPLNCTLPDGFEGLAAHNLISFKSYQEALDGWALSELVGHYVNYRKQVSPNRDNLLPEADFKLFAVSVRFPRGLNSQAGLDKLQEGVYQVRHFSGEIRLVVVHQLPQQSQNALLHLFSAQEEQMRYAVREYRPRSPQTSTFLYQLYDRYREEGMPMPYTKEEFYREAMEKMRKDPDVIRWVLESTTVKERLEGVPVEELLKGLSPEMRESLRQKLQGGDVPSDPS